MEDKELLLDGIDLRRVRKEAVSRRRAADRRRLVLRGLAVSLAVIASFMVAVALGVATST